MTVYLNVGSDSIVLIYKYPKDGSEGPSQKVYIYY